jgi:hypothetical protein
MKFLIESMPHHTAILPMTSVQEGQVRNPRTVAKALNGINWKVCHNPFSETFKNHMKWNSEDSWVNILYLQTFYQQDPVGYVEFFN